MENACRRIRTTEWGCTCQRPAKWFSGRVLKSFIHMENNAIDFELYHWQMGNACRRIRTTETDVEFYHLTLSMKGLFVRRMRSLPHIPSVHIAPRTDTAEFERCSLLQETSHAPWHVDCLRVWAVYSCKHVVGVGHYSSYIRDLIPILLISHPSEKCRWIQFQSPR